MSTEPLHAAPKPDVQLAEIAVELEQARCEQLAAGIISNRRIGIAVGLVMAQHGLGDDDAFEELRRASMNSNRRLVELAEDVIYMRKLTTPPQAWRPDNRVSDP